MVKEMEIYQFNNMPLPPICSYMVSNSSSLFMPISCLNLLYYMDMKRHMLLCIFVVLSERVLKKILELYIYMDYLKQ
jgi:hypothetical protein